MEIKYDMPSCGGCRSCELACSFRHREEFIPVVSSLKIIDKENEPGFLVSLVGENEGVRIACDGCKDLDIPLCIQYCEKREDLEEILKDFMGKVELRRHSHA